MEKKRKPLQIYAIIICVVAVITMIINVSGIVSSIIDRSDPLMATWGQNDLASFETYKMDVLKEVKQDQAYIPSDAEIKSMYEASKTDASNKVIHRSNKDLMTNGIVGIIALVLFISHWMLMKRIDRSES